MELVLIGTGGRAAWDVVTILPRPVEAIEDVAVEIDADRADTEPRVFTRVHMHFVLNGRDLDPAGSTGPSRFRRINTAPPRR